MHKGMTFVLLITCLTGIFSQELNFKVNVVTQSSINSLTNDPAFFADLEKNLTEFLNTTKWTEDEFQAQERIKGAIQLTITEELQANVFKAEMVWQSERPVFNSAYSTPLISLIDKNVSFTWTGLNPLLKTTNTFYDNLSAILSFYVYYTLGMDYESFAQNGGEAHFVSAQGIINSLPSNYVRDDGWKNDGSTRRNRYWLMENVLNPRMRQFRQAFYEYHRLSLDKMYEDTDKSRAIMLSALTSIGQSNIEYPDTYLIQMLGDTKKDEIIEIFKMGDKGQKSKVKAIMVGMDKAKGDKYEVLN
ncbi:MAG: DUF4835 family protein [Saprospiraceae bacterium]|jgi:hypothetical protein|nr:DUF4835 family protein [Saprospiraceae bacterium]